MYINCESCGKEFRIPKCRYGKIKCCSKECRYKNLTGMRSGRLVATGEEKRTNNTIYVKCICDCGNEHWVQRRHILHQTILSCGCYGLEIKAENGKKNKKHGMTNTRIFKIYDGIKYRCGDIGNVNIAEYQGRGIKNHRQNFEEFYADMGESYKAHVKEFGEKNTQIDRIDVNGDYCKENCRWVTVTEQQNNRRSNHPISYKGKDYATIADACRDLGLPYARTLSRINKGRDIDDALEIGRVDNSIKMQGHDFIIKTMRNENQINFVN